MSGVDGEIIKYLAAIGLLVIGAVLKAAFDRIAIERGWTREDKRAQDGKIERVDSHARGEIGRVEREFGNRLGAVERAVARLDEKVQHLPTADDIEEVNRRLSGIEREVSGLAASASGSAEMVRTIRDHILRREN